MPVFPRELGKAIHGMADIDRLMIRLAKLWNHYHDLKMESFQLEAIGLRASMLSTRLLAATHSSDAIHLRIKIWFDTACESIDHGLCHFVNPNIQFDRCRVEYLQETREALREALEWANNAWFLAEADLEANLSAILKYYMALFGIKVSV